VTVADPTPISQIPTNDAVWAPNIRRLAGAPSTPENNGLAVDRNGQTDATGALQAHMAMLAVHGDFGYWGPGQFRTSGELVYPSGIANLHGAGRASTIILPTSTTFNGLRVAAGTMSAAAAGIGSAGVVEGFTVRGPDPKPTPNGRAAIVFDGSPLLTARDLQAECYDIGFDWINNCFNMTHYGLRTTRNVGTVNCGLNIRTGAESGSDFNFYDTQINALSNAVCIAGHGGGYRFYGCSCGTSGVDTSGDDGVFRLGWDYDSDRELSGLGTILISGLHMEGWRRRWAFRIHGSVGGFTVEASGFNPSVTEHGQEALGLVKHTDMRNSTHAWIGNTVGTGSFANSSVAEFSGAWDSATLFETAWASQHCAVGGAKKGEQWLDSLARQARFERGIGMFNQVGTGAAVLALGGGMLRWSNGALQKSNDGGGAWTDIG
jgi:hypothetical protein